MQMFNATTGTWTQMPKPPAPSDGAAGVTGVQGKIYGIGGDEPSDGGVIGATNLVYSFSTKTNTWTEKAPLPTARGFAQAVAAPNGLIYTLGGHTSDPNCDGLPISLSTVEAYNPNTNQWQSSTPMLTPRAHFGAVVANGKIYAIGGEGNLPNDQCTDVGPALSSVEAYSFTSRSWSYVAPLPIASFVDGAVVGADGRIYVLAFASNGGVLYAYNTATNTWTTIGNVPPPPPPPAGSRQTPEQGPITVVGPNRELLLLENDDGDGHFPAAAFTYPT
jgi:hypothetical protein